MIHLKCNFFQKNSVFLSTILSRAVFLTFLILSNVIHIFFLDSMQQFEICHYVYELESHDVRADGFVFLCALIT